MKKMHKPIKRSHTMSTVHNGHIVTLIVDHWICNDCGNEIDRPVTHCLPCFEATTKVTLDPKRAKGRQRDT
jgi:hypothetical protein